MKTIVLIDPSESFAKYATMVLSRLGYNTIHVATIKGGFEIIRNQEPDLIISETVFGDRSAFELFDTLHSNPQFARIPLLVVTSDGRPETREAAQRFGCADFLTKPVTARQLNELMQEHLPFHHKRTALRAVLMLTAEVQIEGRRLEMKSVYIGEGGIFFASDEGFAVGSPMDISLPLPGLKAPLEISGEVVYHLSEASGNLPTGIGVQFTDLCSNTETLLRYYMESYLTDFLPESPA